MDVGVLGGHVLFHVLAEFGRADLAFKLITQKKFPSFGWLIEQGATTLWENFMLPETKWLDSRNHQFWGDVTHWFISCLTGIQYNGADQILDIRPRFIEALDYAAAFRQLNRMCLIAQISFYMSANLFEFSCMEIKRCLIICF